MEVLMTENERKKCLYELYKILNESGLPLQKKKVILRSLFVGESWTWCVTEISKAALMQFEKDKYKKEPHMYDRHHPIPFKKTAEEMLVKPSLSYKDWCRIIDRNEKVHLITKDEHRKWNKEKPEKMFKIKETGLFDNGVKTVGFSYGKREIEFLIGLAEKNLP